MQLYVFYHGSKLFKINNLIKKLRSLTALRKALSETERNIASQATRAYAFVQILISFLLLENNLHGSTTEKVINIFKIPGKIIFL